MAFIRVEPVEVQVRTNWFNGRPREITWGDERLPITRLAAVREEAAAYPVITGPRTLFEVDTPRARLSLIFQHRSRRWTVNGLDEDVAPSPPTGRLIPRSHLRRRSLPRRRVLVGVGAGAPVPRPPRPDLGALDGRCARCRLRCSLTTLSGALAPLLPSAFASTAQRADPARRSGRRRRGESRPYNRAVDPSAEVRFRDLTLERFVAELASAAPVPGGGSASAVAASLAARRWSRWSPRCHGSSASTPQHAELLDWAERAGHELADRFLALADEDAAAFAEYAAAMKLPRETDDERDVRSGGHPVGRPRRRRGPALVRRGLRRADRGRRGARRPEQRQRVERPQRRRPAR